MLNTEVPYDLAIPFLGYMPKTTENICSHKNVYTNVHSSIIHNSQILEKIQMPIH